MIFQLYSLGELRKKSKMEHYKNNWEIIIFKVCKKKRKEKRFAPFQ